MVKRKISTFYEDPPGSGRAEVWMDYKDDVAYIEYYDDQGKLFFTEDFPNNSIRYAEDAAENWAIGIKQLEIN